MFLMIGILSDTHDNLDAVRSAVQVFKDAGCSLVIHAGDFVAPFAARELAKAACPVRAVYGNCDGEKAGLEEAIKPFGAIREPPLEFAEAGLSFLVFHLDAPARKASRRGTSNVVIFGHTHKPEVRREGRTIVINPGEACGWLSGIKTVALLDPASLSAEIIPL
jgi:uncharacterized protein